MANEIIPKRRLFGVVWLTSSVGSLLLLHAPMENSSLKALDRETIRFQPYCLNRCGVWPLPSSAVKLQWDPSSHGPHRNRGWRKYSH